MKNSGFTFRKRLASFRYAFNGIRLLIQKEHNADNQLYIFLA